MEQYISKSAIVAEIEKRIKEIEEIGTYLSPKGTLTNLLCYINALEVIKIGVDICAPEGDKSTVYDTYPIMEPPHIVLANIDVAKMVKEKEKFFQQILLPFGYSEDHVEQMVTSYRQGIIDTLEKIEKNETDEEE